MSVFCRCGKLATHTVRWNPWVDAAEPYPSSRRPAYCRPCAITEAEARTDRRHEQEEWERSFNPATRVVYRTVAKTPHAWDVAMRNAVRRHAEHINPRGLVRLYKQDGRHYVELWPPKERPETWQPENALYLIRYLTRRPLVFEAVDPAQLDRSPTTWRESRELSAGTVPAVTTPGSSDEPTGTGGGS